MSSDVLSPDAAALDMVARKFDLSPADWVELARRGIERVSSRTRTAVGPEALLALKGEARLLDAVGRAGAMLRIGDVTARLGVKRDAVHKRKAKGQLIALRLPGTNYDSFPALQFNKDGTVHPWVEPLIASTGSGAAALTYLTARRESLDGRSFAERLIAGETGVEQELTAKLKEMQDGSR